MAPFNKMTSSRKSIFYLLSIMVLASLIITISITSILYHYEFNAKKAQLLASVEHQKHLIEAVAKYDSSQTEVLLNENPDYDAFSATLSQLSDAYLDEHILRQPVEFTLTHMENDSIVHLIFNKAGSDKLTDHVSMKSQWGEAENRALHGLTGVMTSLNHVGKQVLAAYTNVKVLNVALVATLELYEIRKPFIRAAGVGVFIAIMIILLGGIVFLRIGNPLVHRLEGESALAFEASILSNLSQAVNLVSMDALEIIYTNKAFDALFGYGNDELLGCKVSILNSTTQQDPNQQASEISESIAATGSWEGELLNRKKDGSEFWTHASVSTFTTREARQVLISVQRDISKLKILSDDLRRNEKLLNETGQMGKIGGWEIDLTTMTPFFTRETYNIHELSPDLPPPSVIDGLNNYPPEARPIIEKLVNEAIEEHKSYDVELPFVTAKGKQLWVRTGGKVELDGDKAVRLIGIIQDITATRKIQTILLESEASLKEAQRIAKLGSYRVNLLENTLEWSDEMYTILGVDKGDHTPTLENFAQFVHPNDTHLISEEAFGNSIKEQFHEFEYRILTKDTSQIKHIRVQGETLYNTLGHAIAITATFQDITELKIAELEILERDEINRAITQSATDAIISIDAWGSIISWNPAAESMFGRASGDMIEKNILEIFPSEDQGEQVRSIIALREDGPSDIIGKTVELLGLRSNGETFPLELSLAKWKKGRAVNYAGIIRDISARKDGRVKTHTIGGSITPGSEAGSCWHHGWRNSPRFQ